MLESYHVKVKNDNVLEILKKLLCAVDEQYNKTKFLNLLNYKHLLITSAQVMELTEKEQNIFVFVFNSACISRPITVSNNIFYTPLSNSRFSFFSRA